MVILHLSYVEYKSPDFDAEPYWFKCGSILGLLHVMALHGLSLHRWDVAFAIYVTTGVKIDLALLYCSMQGADNVTLCREILELRYLAESVDCLNAVVEGKDCWFHVKSDVEAWLAEYSLNEWIGEMNQKLGVAPSCECVFDHYKSLCTHRCDFDSVYVTPESRRKWVNRFMHRWQSFRGCIHSHEADGVAAVLDKVLLKTQKKTTFLRRF